MIDVKAAFLLAAGQGVRYETHDIRAGVLVINYSVGDQHYRTQAKAKNTAALAMHRAVKVCASDARDTADALSGRAEAFLKAAKETAGIA